MNYCSASFAYFTTAVLRSGEVFSWQDWIETSLLGGLLLLQDPSTLRHFRSFVTTRHYLTHLAHSSLSEREGTIELMS